MKIRQAKKIAWSKKQRRGSTAHRAVARVLSDCWRRKGWQAALKMLKVQYG